MKARQNLGIGEIDKVTDIVLYVKRIAFTANDKIVRDTLGSLYL